MEENTDLQLVSYSLRVLVKGAVRMWGTGVYSGLTEESILRYEELIQDKLYDMDEKGQACDLHGLLTDFPVVEVKEKIEENHLSVISKNGVMYGNLEILTKGSLSEWEREALADYVKTQFLKKGGKHFLKETVCFRGGFLDFWMDSPKEYCFLKQKKYEITDIAHPKYPWLHRIRALKTIETCKGIEVRAGNWGGYVQSEKNLSQEGICWIDNDAICCGDAVVEGAAQLYHWAVAKDSARISGDAELSLDARAEGKCHVQSGVITDHAVISGEALIKKEMGYAPRIDGYSRIYGTLSGKYWIRSTTFPEGVYHNATEKPIYFLEGEQMTLDGEPESRSKKKFSKPEKKQNHPER